MRTAQLLIATMALLAGAGSLAAVAPPDALRTSAPGTESFVWIPNTSKARVAWQAHFPSRLWSDPAMAQFRTAFGRLLSTDWVQPLTVQLGWDPLELLSLATGELVVGNTPPARTGTVGRFFFSLETGTNAFRASNLLARASHTVLGPPGPDGCDLHIPVMLAPALPGLSATFGQGGSASRTNPIILHVRWVNDRCVASTDREWLDPFRAPSPHPPTSPGSAGLFPHSHSPPADAILIARWREPAPPTASAEPESARDRLRTALGWSGVESTALIVKASRRGWGIDLSFQVPDGNRSGVLRLFSVPAASLHPGPGFAGESLSYLRARVPGRHAWTTLQTSLQAFDSAALGFFQLLAGYAGRTEDADFSLEKRVIDLVGDDWILAQMSSGGVHSNRAAVLAVGSTRPTELVEALRTVAAPSYLSTFLPPDAPPPVREDSELNAKRLVSVQFPEIPALGLGPGSVYFTAGKAHVLFSFDKPALEQWLSAEDSRASDNGPDGNVLESASPGVLLHISRGETLGSWIFKGNESPAEELGLASTLRWLAGPTPVSALIHHLQTTASVAPLPQYERVDHHFGLRVDRVDSTPDEVRFSTFYPLGTPREHAGPQSSSASGQFRLE